MRLATKIIIETLHCTEAQADAVEFQLYDETPGFYWNNATREEMTKAINKAAKQLRARKPRRNMLHLETP